MTSLKEFDVLAVDLIGLQQQQQKQHLEALRERRPPWPRQIITAILPTVKMLSPGGERLPPPKKMHHDLGMLPLL